MNLSAQVNSGVCFFLPVRHWSNASVEGERCSEVLHFGVEPLRYTLSLIGTVCQVGASSQVHCLDKAWAQRFHSLKCSPNLFRVVPCVLGQDKCLNSPSLHWQGVLHDVPGARKLQQVSSNTITTGPYIIINHQHSYINRQSLVIRCY